VIIVLIIYLWTLSPEVTLEWSGIYATGAMYCSIGPPPGFPGWIIYSWVFTKILPFGNIAWRIAVSSSVAGALTCGVIALMVSRGGEMVLRSTRGFKRLIPPEESKLRLVCGMVAGLGFGFQGMFWNFAVIIETLSLGLLMMATVLCLLLRWGSAPRQNGYLCAAAFLFGLTLTVRISLASLAPTLPFLVLFFRPAVGRDLIVLITTVLGALLWCSKRGWLPSLIEGPAQLSGLWTTYLALAIAYALVSIVQVIKSRELFTRWRPVLRTVALLFCGLSVYLYLPLASMTNPPVNWGYARSAEGFLHVLNRGQWEHIMPVHLEEDPGRYFQQMFRYFDETIHAMGWIYVIPAIVPLFFIFRMRGRARRWMLGLLASFVALSFFMVAMLNPPPDRGSWSLLSLYLPASHLVLTVLAGYGLAFLGTIAARDKQPNPRPEVIGPAVPESSLLNA
jgi:hypothetical protein